MRDSEKKILVIRLGAIGDVAHTTIIPKSIKLAHPNYKIHYLTQKEIAPMLNNNPYIDKVIPLNTKQKRELKYITDVGKQLFQERYDIIFCLTNSLRNILLSLIACPKKIVFKSNKGGLWVENFFNTAKKAIKDITIPDSLTLGVDSQAQTKIQEVINNRKRPYTIIIPGGGTDQNRQGRIWNIKNWQILTSKILEKYGGTVFVCGGKNEKKYHQQLEGENIVITSGDFNLAESSALLSNADLVISGDTGPLHIASAHNIKTLALLGSTSPDKIKPYGKNGYYISSDYSCKYCWKKKCKQLKSGEKYTPCMENLTPDMVLGKIQTENLI